jgi:hypothetical protein
MKNGTALNAAAAIPSLDNSVEMGRRIKTDYKGGPKLGKLLNDKANDDYGVSVPSGPKEGVMPMLSRGRIRNNYRIVTL